MDDLNHGNLHDGRLLAVLFFLFALLLFDLGRENNSSFFKRSKDRDICQQLQYVQPDSLVVENCLDIGKEHVKKTVSPRSSPFLFAAMPINSADKEMLMTVDGIGPVLAEDILAYRRQFGQFTSSRDLLNLSGVGTKRAARFATTFTFTEKP